MGSLIDLTNQQFDCFTVLRRDLNKSTEVKDRHVYWDCVSKCGKNKSFSSSVIKEKQKKEQFYNCEKCKYFPIGVKAGMVYGYLTVIERDYEYPITHNIKTKTIRYWKCKCKCGNFTTVNEYNLKYGRVKSCGCYARLRSSETHINDLTGQVFGRLTVLCDSNNRWRSSDGAHSAVYWHTRCECGNEIDVLGAHLLNGNVASCGCLRSQRIIELNRINLVGKFFGRLHVLYENGKNEKGFLWHTRCECGNEVDVETCALTSGRVQSCGCIKSIGEANIQKVLQENNICFEKEKTFEDLISDKGGKYRYDFFLSEYNRLIEFDGIQHYEYNKNESGWNTKEKFEKTQQSDKIKNEYALSHNISLVRIPYWERDKITLDTLLGDKYLVYEEPVLTVDDK